MASINTGRLIIGGLAAGLVENVFDILWSMTIMAPDQAAMAQRFGMDPASAQSPAMIVPWVIIGFLNGLLIVWTYAAIRPRFGPGPKTAIIAALIPFIGTSIVVFGFTNMGMMGHMSFLKGSVTELVSYVAAGLVGGWLYKEA